MHRTLHPLLVHQKCFISSLMLAIGPREYVSAPGKVFPRFGLAPRVGVEECHSSVWPLEWSITHKRGIL